MRALHLASLLAGLALAALSGRSLAEEAPPIVPPWAQAFLDAWYSAYNSGDASAWQSYSPSMRRSAHAKAAPNRG